MKKSRIEGQNKFKHQGLSEAEAINSLEMFSLLSLNHGVQHGDQAVMGYKQNDSVEALIQTHIKSLTIDGAESESFCSSYSVFNDLFGGPAMVAKSYFRFDGLRNRRTFN
jgi:hypothetical protein